MDDIRIGIVGMGPRGRSWVETFKRVKGIRVAAICEKIGPLLQQAKDSSGDPGIDTYTDFDQMLSSAELEAVGVAVEPHNQPDLVCEALGGGKHVICEVPLAYTLEDCWRIVVAVEKSELKFEMAEQLRYSPYVYAWKKMVEEGTLGKAIFAEGQYLHGMAPDRYWFDAETGRRLTWDEARGNPRARKSRVWYMPHPILYLPHDLSPILKVLDDRVTRVTCMSTRRLSYRCPEFPIPDIEVSLMRTEKDTLLRMAAGFIVPTPIPYHWHRIMGTKGEVETNRSTTDSMKMWLADMGTDTKTDISWEFTDELAPPEARETGHGGLDYYPMADFVRSIREDSEPDMDVYRAAETAAPAILAASSAEQHGQPLDVPDFRPTMHRRRGRLP